MTRDVGVLPLTEDGLGQELEVMLPGPVGSILNAISCQHREISLAFEDGSKVGRSGDELECVLTTSRSLLFLIDIDDADSSHIDVPAY